MTTMSRWSFSTMIASFVLCFLLCFLLCTSLIAGATIKPTNGGRTIRKDNGNPTGHGPSSPSRPIVVTTQPPTKPPTPAPSPAPTYKPTNPARKPSTTANHRGPTRSPAQIAADALANTVLAALEPLLTAIGTNNLGCPYAADDLRRGIFDTTKYQGKAAMYVYSLIQPGLELPTVLLYVLACLYFATGGPNWNDSNNWLTRPSDPCSWSSVRCDEGGTLTRLNIKNNMLKGVVPCEIVLLSGDHPSHAGALELVSFQTNPDLNTGGSAGSQWIAGLGKNLATLDISETSFGTRFPPNLGTKTPKLKYIRAGNAAVTGDLSFLVGLDPAEIGVSNNNIHGTIPPSLFSGIPSTNLYSFYASNNQLSGKLPQFGNTTIFPLGFSFQLRLDGNQLTGSIPESYGSASFYPFYLFDNNLTGSVPADFCPQGGKIGVDCISATVIGAGPPPVEEVACNTNCNCCCSLQECESA